MLNLPPRWCSTSFFITAQRRLLLDRTSWVLLISLQVWDYISSELVHNVTYAHRLPPTFIEQARGLANLRENAVFSDDSMGGIGNSKLLSLGGGNYAYTVLS